MDYTDNKNYEDYYKIIYKNKNFTVYFMGEFEEPLSNEYDEDRFKYVNRYLGIDDWGRKFYDTNKSRLIKRIKDYHKKVLSNKGTLERV